MADISDVTRALVNLAVAAVYPNGSGAASISGHPVRLYQGWPDPVRLDQDLTGKALDANGALRDTGLGPAAQVSVFPMLGQSPLSSQVFEPDFVVIPAVHGIAATVVGQTVNLSGAPGAKEFVAIIADGRHCYSRTGSSLANICAQLLADAQADYPTATGTSSGLTIPAASLVARIGANATMGRLLHRQKQQIMTTVWAASPAERATLGAAIDIAFKRNLRLTFPDTSQAILTFDRVNEIDDHQIKALYRRDLIYAVEYATVDLFDAYEVTSVSTTTTASDVATTVIS